MSINTTDIIKCSNCGCVLAKDDACSSEDGYWFCPDCYRTGQEDGEIDRDIYED